MDEFALIERFFARRVAGRADIRLGIGDDAAVTRCDPDADLVIATDTIVEGTHFLPGTPAREIGHRCLAVNLSDLAAMGAEPRWCTLSLTMPDADPNWVDAFADGFFALAERYGVALIGGDTVHGPLSVTVTVHGLVATGQAICRGGARAGDLIFVTGVPGLAAAGLRALRDSATDAASAAVERFAYPEPRVAEGLALRGLATAMIDVSDGLAVDATRMLSASALGAAFDLSRLPLDVVGADDALELALTGGDDYELCFCLPPEREAELVRRSADWACRAIRIGRTRDERDIDWLLDGQPCEPAGAGFEHFPEQP